MRRHYTKTAQLSSRARPGRAYITAALALSRGLRDRAIRRSPEHRPALPGSWRPPPAAPRPKPAPGGRGSRGGARPLPSGLALMKTRTLRPPGTRWAGSAARLPAKAALRSAASRGHAALPPAPAAHMAPPPAGPRLRAAPGPRRGAAALRQRPCGSFERRRGRRRGKKVCGGDGTRPLGVFSVPKAGTSAGGLPAPLLRRALHDPGVGFL